MSPDVVRGLRDVFRILRYVTDMLGEIAMGHQRFDDGHEGPVGFKGKDHNTLVNYEFYNGVDLPFRTGDVLLVRGHAHNSAAIARIGTCDSQFSHTGIIHIDDTGKHWMVESLIEDGAIINTLSHALSHNVVRAVLYRHKDPELAARAAAYMYDLIKRARRPILYDFTMQLDDRRKLFCSKLVRNAFAEASEGRVKLSTYQTRIEMKNRDFLKRIGVHQ